MTKKKEFTKLYGAPMMRDLVVKARNLHINVDFHVNSEGRYVVTYMRHGYVAPNVSAACFFVLGMMARVADPIGDLFAANWVLRPPLQKTDTAGAPGHYPDAP